MTNMNGLQKLKCLYDNEINFSLSVFWDEGFRWRLGDGINGWHEEGSAASPSSAISALYLAAMARYADVIKKNRLDKLREAAECLKQTRESQYPDLTSQSASGG